MTIKLGVIALAGPDHGGTYQYTLSTLQALQHTTGFDVTIYGDPKNSDFAALGFRVAPFSESRARQFAALAAYRLGVALSDPFVGEDLLLAPIYSLALLHTSRPFAYTLHDVQEWHYPANFSRRQRAWRRQVHEALLHRASRVICESRFVKADIVRFFGIGEARTTVIPAPPQPQFRSPLNEQQLDAARTKLQLPEKFLFYPAQFWTHKNHLRLIEAFRDVTKEVPGLSLVLTGKERDEYQAVMDTIGRLDLSAHVRHLGHIEQQDLQAVYQLATALVMPSLFESISIPIYEAFQLGIPVAASNILAIPEQVGNAGLLFDPTSVTSIRDAILEMVRHPEAARQRTVYGRERIAAMTPERYGRQLQDLLRQLEGEPIRTRA